MGDDGDCDTELFTRGIVPAFEVGLGLGFWAAIFGSCWDVVFCNVVLRPESGVMEFGLMVAGGIPGLADEELRDDGEGVGGQAGILYNDGLRRMSEESGV